MNSCPSPDIIAQFAQGSLPAESLDAVGSHVADCDECQFVVASLNEAPETEPVSPSQDSQPKLTRGVCVGRYVIISLLGEGGMGSVYLAYDPELDRKVALKLVQVSGLGAGAAAIVQERLAREAQAMARLTHPNVVTVHDVLLVDGRLYVAMEYVEGGTLRSWLRSSPPPAMREVVNAFIEAGEGLAAAHAAGIVHRDFKPANVLIGIGKNRRVRVTDFGVARAIDSLGVDPDVWAITPYEETPGSRLSTPLTHFGSVVGTPAYLSPEGYGGKKVDALSDQFSFCVALYEGLYGQRPFSVGPQDSLAGSVMLGRIDPPPAGSKVPSWLRKIVIRGLSVDPSERYPSMEALLSDLRRDPDAERSRRLKTIAVGFFIAAIAGVATWWQLTRQAPCQGGASRLAGIWDSATRTQLEQTFRAIDAPYALDAWAATRLAIDDYSSAWLRSQQQACEETLVRRIAPESLMVRRMACLSHRLHDLKDLVAQLQSANAAIAANAVDAALRLPDIGQCVDEIGLGRELVLPTDPTLRQRTESILEEIARHRNAIALGRYDAAQIPEVEALISRIDALAISSLSAEALLMLGRLQGTFQGVDAAERTLKRALVASLAAQRFDLMVLTLRTLLVLKMNQRDVATLSQWIDWGDAALEAAGVDDALRCRWDGVKAVAQTYLGSSQGIDAERRIPQLMTVCRRAFGDRPADLAAAEQFAGSVLQQLGRPETAVLPYLTRALELTRKSLGNHHEQTAVALHNLADVKRNAGHLDEALNLEQEAVQIAEGARSTGLGVHFKRLICLIQRERNDVADALAACERAMRAADEVYGPQSQMHLDGLAQWASALLMADRRKESRSQFDAFYAEAKKLKLDETMSTAAHYIVYLDLLELPRERPLAARLVELALRAFGDDLSAAGERERIVAWKAKYLAD